MADERKKDITLLALSGQNGSEAGTTSAATSSDMTTNFLRSARSGNVEKLLEYIKHGHDINSCNANGLNAVHLASKEGHVKVVSELLDRGATIDTPTKKGNTALHISCLAGQLEIVRVLVQHGANVNVQSQNGFTPLYMAAQENHSDVVKYLLMHGASQTLATEDGFTPLAVALQQGHDKVVAVLLENDSRGRVKLPALHIAAKKDDVKAATLLLQSDPSTSVLPSATSAYHSSGRAICQVNDTTKSGFTPLHIASHYGNTSVGKLLIEKGGDANYKARNNITPLHVSSKWGKSGMVTLLIDKGKAHVDSKTRDGLTPLHCAARSGHERVVDLLLSRGASVVIKTKNGLTPLHMAVQGDHVDCVALLIDKGAPIDDVTIDYLTPLHVAAHCGNVRSAKVLLDRKCEPNSRALNGFTPLHIACKKNRFPVVELLLKYKGSIEATTESGLTPLHVAAFMGNMNIVMFLLQAGANPNCSTVRGETPLHLAARANQTDIIRVLLRNGGHVNAKAREQQSPLHIASRLGNVDNVLLLLQHGATPDTKTADQYTPLHVASKEGHLEVVQVLVDHGANVDSLTKKGFAPLHIATKYGHMALVKYLIEKKANVDEEGKNSLTPLHVATHYNNVPAALVLLENKADPQKQAKNGYTPLHVASRKNQMDAAGILLNHGAQPDCHSKNGFTPLHLCCQQGFTDMTSLLLENKADPSSKSKNGLTPLHLAAQEDKVDVAKILKSFNCDMDSQTKAGYTALHTACHFGQLNMVKFLLENGALVNLKTRVGYTPLHQAAQQGHVAIVGHLLKNGANPNATTNNGQSAMSIAQRLGYISVVELLRHVTNQPEVTSSVDEKYKVVAPEVMQEAAMSDSEDEGVDEPQVNDMNESDMKLLKHDSIISGKEMDPASVAYTNQISYSSMYISPFETSTQPKLLQERTYSTTSDIPYANEHPVPATPLMKTTDLESKIICSSSYSGTSVHSNLNADNVAIDQLNFKNGRYKWKNFLVSFLVDARGGAMSGCRHSGVRILVPPNRATMPTRVTCKLVKKEKLSFPPQLLEGEGLATRILVMGPAGVKFDGPILIEVPHFASLRDKEREICILRSDNGETWYEHGLSATEGAVQEVLEGNFDDVENAENFYQRRVTRILTSDLPEYFAIVTRLKQEISVIGPQGGIISSTVVPQVQAVFPEGALTKNIKVGLQVLPIQPDLVTKMLGNRIAVSPCVTIEPRRRKFHKPITLTLPLPKASQKSMMNQYASETPTLRLLCSLAGGSMPALWEDITATTPLTFVQDCVSFTTTVSARFWLMDCQNISDSSKMAMDLYRESILVPMFSRFVVFSKRLHTNPQEARLRVFCVTDDKVEKTLETQEHFEEIATSRATEVLDGRPLFIEMVGNLVPITKSDEQLSLRVKSFHENRLPFLVRIRNPDEDASGRIFFMHDPKHFKNESLPPQTPICNLMLNLPELSKSDSRRISTEDIDRICDTVSHPISEITESIDVKKTTEAELSTIAVEHELSPKKKKVPTATLR